jgi:Reverse transcriptase (RNA-dependent DNA polymerase)
MDVKSAFLSRLLDKEICLEQPQGFIVADLSDNVCLPKKALYGLNLASRAWNLHFHGVLTELGSRACTPLLEWTCIIAKMVGGSQTLPSLSTISRYCRIHVWRSIGASQIKVIRVSPLSPDQHASRYFIPYGARGDELYGYLDSSLGDQATDYHSTSGLVILMADAAITWSSRKQKTTAQSTTQAEYMALTDTASQAAWYHSFLTELGYKIPDSIPLHSDTLST